MLLSMKTSFHEPNQLAKTEDSLGEVGHSNKNYGRHSNEKSWWKCGYGSIIVIHGFIETKAWKWHSKVELIKWLLVQPHIPATIWIMGIQPNCIVVFIHYIHDTCSLKKEIHTRHDSYTLIQSDCLKMDLIQRRNGQIKNPSAYKDVRND